jgi:hypothetical protein
MAVNQAPGAGIPEKWLDRLCMIPAVGAASSCILILRDLCQDASS